MNDYLPTMHYYEVTAKCGHVGCHNYILKKFYVRAENGRKAAAKVRELPRVKHGQKDAIREVVEVSAEDFYFGEYLNELDPFFKATSKQEQKKLGAVKQEEVIPEERPTTYKQLRNGRQLRYDEQLRYEQKEMLQYRY